LIKLSPQERDRLKRIIEGESPGSYFGAITLLNLSEGRTAQLVSEATFCSVEEIKKVEAAYEKGGMEAVIKFEL